MSTFDEMRRASLNLAKELHKMTGVRQAIVLNVIQYARRLCHPSRPDLIEELVFIAQMGLRFGITSVMHVKLMFDAIRVKDTKVVHINEYVRLMCVFYSRSLDVKIDFAFSVYDFYHDGQICTNEMTALLKSAIVSATNDEDDEEHLKELINIVIYVFDNDGDGQISLEEFREKVHNNILYIQLLGQVLPHKDTIDAFMEHIRTKTPLAVREFFADERSLCLREPILEDTSDKFYPLTLDLP